MSKDRFWLYFSCVLLLVFVFRALDKLCQEGIAELWTHAIIRSQAPLEASNRIIPFDSSTHIWRVCFGYYYYCCCYCCCCCCYCCCYSNSFNPFIFRFLTQITFLRNHEIRRHLMTEKLKGISKKSFNYLLIILSLKFHFYLRLLRRKCGHEFLMISEKNILKQFALF